MLNYETALAVYQYGSWAEASYATFQSPSSVSKRISKLEKELGVQIFERASRSGGAVLTSMGSIVMPYIRQIVDVHNEISSRAEELRGSMQTNVKIGYQFLAGSIGVAEILAGFRVQNPDIGIAHILRGKSGIADLICSGEIDCAFLFYFDEDMVKSFAERLEASHVAMLPYLKCDTLWVGMPRSNSLSQRDTVKLSELYGETFIVNSTTGVSSLRRIFNDKTWPAGGDIPFKTRPIDYVSRQVVTEYIASGVGVLPTICMPPQDASDAVRYVKVEDVKPKATASFLYNKENPTKAVKALLGFVREIAEGRREFEYK